MIALCHMLRAFPKEILVDILKCMGESESRQNHGQPSFGSLFSPKPQPTTRKEGRGIGEGGVANVKERKNIVSV